VNSTTLHNGIGALDQMEDPAMQPFTMIRVMLVVGLLLGAVQQTAGADVVLERAVDGLVQCVHGFESAVEPDRFVNLDNTGGIDALQDSSGVFIIIDLGTGERILRLDPVSELGLDVRIQGYADIDNDGVREVILDGFGAVVAWDPLPEIPDLLLLPGDAHHYSVSYIGDADGDGHDEVVVIHADLIEMRMYTETYGAGPPSAVSENRDAKWSVLMNVKSWPNPSSSSQSITFALVRESRVSVRIFDIGGREVDELVNQVLPAGQHEYIWHGEDTGGRSVATGTYYYEVETPHGRQVGELTRIE
jgi:hypothetical protein